MQALQKAPSVCPKALWGGKVKGILPFPRQRVAVKDFKVTKHKLNIC